MTEPFPSKAYREEAKKYEDILRELFVGFDSGDWALRKEDDWVFLVVEADLELEVLTLYGGPDVRFEFDDTMHWQERYLRLPTLCQLIEMVEERGWKWELRLGGPEGYGLVMSPIEGIITLTSIKYHPSPDPETAVLRALAEVVEKKDG